MRKKAIFALLLWALLVVSPAFSACAAPEPTSVQLEVEAVLTGDVPSSPETFTFVLEAVGQDPMPEINTITMTGSGTCSFSPITYSEPGTFLYTIRQRSDAAEGYTYDDTVYTVTVQVAADDTGTLKPSVYAYEADHDGKAENIVFSNHYTAPEPAQSGGTSPVQSNPDQTNAPKTQDESNPVFWISLGSTSLVCLMGILFFWWRKSRAINSDHTAP